MASPASARNRAVASSRPASPRVATSQSSRRAVISSSVAARRLDWLVATLGEAGLDEATARFRAEAGLATYLGLFHLQRAQGRRFGERELRAHIMRAVDGMLA